MEHTIATTTDVGDRLSELFAHYQVTPYQAAQKLGHTHASKIYSLVNKRARPSHESLVEILEAWPEISTDWLVMGRGPMLRSEAAGAVMTSNVNPASGHGVTSGRVLAVTVDRVGNENILHIPARAQAGYSRSHDEPAYLRDLTPYSLPILTTGGTFRSFDVEGDSMKPTFGHRDIVIGQFVERWDLLQPGHCYVVVLSDNVLVKRLPRAVKSKRDSVELMSDNRAYPVHEVPAADILELWHVRGYLSTNIPASGREVQERILELLETMGLEQQQLRRILEERATSGATNASRATK